MDTIPQTQIFWQYQFFTFKMEMKKTSYSFTKKNPLIDISCILV